MRCEEVNKGLVDLLEATVEPQARRSVQEHLASCEGCRAEFELLRRGKHGLLEAVGRLAPRKVYLTQERLSVLLARPRPGRRWPRIITIERVVAAVAAAAMLVSGVSMYLHWRSPEGSAPPVMSAGRASARAGLRDTGAAQVAFTLAPDDRQLRVVVARMTFAPYPGAALQGAGVQYADMVRTSSPGVYVPVRNVFYDFEDSAYWW